MGRIEVIQIDIVTLRILCTKENYIMRHDRGIPLD